jgi:ABC-type uncharacterized transport system ATPase subunit
LEEPWRGCSTEDRIAIQDFLLQLPSSTTVVVVTNDSDFIGRAPYRIEMNTSDQESKNQSA